MSYRPLFLAAALWFCAPGTAFADVVISGSDTLESYFQNAIAQYARGAGANVPIKAEYKGTGKGFQDLCEGKAAIVPASTKLEGDALARCQQRGVGFVELPIAYDAVVVIANPARAAMGSITMEELKKVFSPDNFGKVTRWSQVRGNLPDAPFAVVSLDAKSGTNTFFSTKVHGLKGFVRGDAKVTGNHEDVARMVAADPNAIGFASMGALADTKAAVWPVPVNFGNGPVVPSAGSVLNDSYGPLSRLLYVYVSKSALAAQDGHTKAFVTWLLERGGKMARFEGFVPLVDENYAAGVRKLSAK
jgi:phosphate transport system substrate-binding protein